jgi:hypothetical protein
MTDLLRPSSPAVQMMGLINGYQISQALHVVATLGIADLLRDGPRSSDALADRVEADRDGTRCTGYCARLPPLACFMKMRTGPSA